MNLTRTTTLIAVAALAGSALASNEGTRPETLNVTYGGTQVGAVTNAALNFIKPKVGIRIGGGQWNEFMVNAGVDVMFNVPLLPLPAIRIDAEVWGKPSGFGKDRRGNAVSVLGVQTLALGGYFGLGPTYYFSDNNGDHKSGLGAKLLGGWNFPLTDFFVEGGLLIGPSPTPLFITVGKRF
ncbi:hypothetical protein [Fimbriimonas ginsengisoli]|uniref:Outer membrane protein beta-barrel domain-containing protein n=1 Tax=Fimbriimonas ginsengisoli Gsoil 348 TaxID=661478 RepID=A0A068NKA1_FIMGI|nr:hypothetical protein [Fimbriimonas ginsengisoli]AIE83877.1 hypothetical protein OP10G_0509 [Fimbriimonas ginsengisoli Gsoil 348]